MLKTAEHRWVPTLPHERTMTALEVMACRQGRQPGTGTAEGPFVHPFVSHGRWGVRCPECGSACQASRFDPRFWCPTCFTDGDPWLPVAWTPDCERAETALSVRPVLETRNWRAFDPDEPVAVLEAENTVYLTRRVKAVR